MGSSPPRVVANLEQIDAADLPLAGGKAANLGELLQAGFRVPPGFVITTTAYDRVVATNGIGELVARIPESGDGAAIRTAFEQAAIPSDIEQAILADYRQLGSGSVAVRSSATAEDLADAAFAGQQDSFLGIVDEAALLSAVRRCWGSLGSDRAIAYREKHRFAHADVKLAVVVQRLIAADTAGVMFTANPTTGARDETVIDASSGLGEAIVSGLVTPDHVVLRKGRFAWRIVERRLGQREIEVRPKAGGGVEQVAGTLDAGPALPDSALRRLARLGAAIQRLFDRPQDVEWAWANGKLFVLQSRPITALPEPVRRRPFGLPATGPSEYFQIRPYPLDMTSWMPAMSAALIRMFPLGRAMPRLDQMWIEEDGVITRFAEWPSVGSSVDLLLMPLRLIPLAIHYDPARWRDDPILADALARVHELESRDLRAKSGEDLLATVREALTLPIDIVELRHRYFPRAVLALAGLRLALGLLHQENCFGDLLSGVDNKTLEANRQLESLAAEIRADPALAAIFAQHDPTTIWDALAAELAGRAFLAKLRAFLAAYGHRETGSPLLISQPTWKDSPEPVLGILKGLALAAPAPHGGKPPWEVARDAVLAIPAMRIPPFRAAFLALLSEARQFSSLREDTHFALTMAMPVVRRTFLELGRRLADVGILESAEEVFHLRFDELEQATNTWPPAPPLAQELESTVRHRAERRAALADTPVIALPAQTTAVPSGDALLAGTPGSRGVAEGPVRIVRDATGFGALQLGEILVAPYTNPSWTPLFGRAAAVIVDAGSAVSHAAIVAREYGIPAVMGTGDAMTRLHDGQRVRVDGTRGLVFDANAASDISLVLDQPIEKTLRRE
jgi:phosphohistidine swiveling domain-containing protein